MNEYKKTNHTSGVMEDKDIVLNPFLYISDYIKTKKLLEKGKTKRDIIFLILLNLQSKNLNKKIPKHIVDESVYQFFKKKEEENINNFLEKIKFDKKNEIKNLKLLRLFLENYLGYCDKYIMKVWYRFLQNIKIKLIYRGSRSLEEPFMIVVPSFKQGLGKSYNLEFNLFGIFKKAKLYAQGTFEILTDSRYAGILEKKPIIFLDEMGRAGKSDISIIKNILSQNEITIRKPYAREPENINIISSFIGTSNSSLVDIMRDTGMRRFREFEMKNEITKGSKQAEILNNIDYTKLWQSIDVDNNDIFNDKYIKNTEKHVNKLITTDTIDFFIKYFDIKIKENQETELISKISLYENYKKLMKAENTKNIFGRNRFYSKLKEKGIEEKVYNNSMRSFKINKNRNGEEELSVDGLDF